MTAQEDIMPFLYYYGFDWTYIVLVIPFLILSIWASARVNTTFKHYSQQHTHRGITAADAAKKVLQMNGVSNVQIEHISGNLTDHFDPRTNVIRLSDNVYNSTSTAAIGVACHEAGHAVQYAQNYSPIKLRTAIIPITNFGSKLAMPLILLGILLTSFGYYSIPIVYLGIACFGLSLVFQLITLPVEFNASRRAMQAIISADMLTLEEQVGAKKTLSAAAMTYVAAAAVSLAQLLRLILLFGGGRRRND
jgi:Zn-dependent membrane protease YugP